ncbi:MAG: outer membrane protein assembly factor BamA [Saprospirales bacterium]|nr:MAG: outer membrane protein assembly factor BamA [Saprospirales bacterium]
MILRLVNYFALALSLLLFSLPAFAQDPVLDSIPVSDFGTVEELEIGGITITGAEFSDQQAIIAVSGLQVGNRIRIPGRDITNAMKKLWDLRLFEDVRILQTQRVGEVVFLEIQLVERPRFLRHSLEGVKRSYHDDLNQKLSRHLRRGSIVTENALRNIERDMLGVLRDKGYLDATMRIEQKPDARISNSIELNIFFDTGSKVRIRNIRFTGNEEVSNRRLRREMNDTKERRRLFATSRFDRELYHEDKKSVINYYQTLGYSDARITGDSIWRDEGGRLNILIHIDEGNKYFVRNIAWSGNTLYDDRTLSSVLGINKGDPYNKDLMEQRLNFSMDGRDINSLYMDDGYLFFNVTPIETAIDNDSIDFEMRIFEGPQANIDRVVIRGNDRTHEHVVRRELRTRPGRKFSRADIIRSQREIMNLGYFDGENLGINTPVNPQRYTVDIEYDLTERPSDQVELSAGWGGFSGLIGTLGVQFNNFSVRNIGNRSAWRPLPQGDGQRLSLRAQTNGRFFQSYNASFTEPWLGGNKPTSFSVGGYYTKFSSFFSSQATGSRGSLAIARGFVGLGTRLPWPDDNFIFNATLNIENISLNDYGSFFTFEGLPVDFGSYNNFSIKTTIARTSLADPIFPRSGSRISLSIQFTPPYSLFKSDNFWVLDDAEREALIANENAKIVERGGEIMTPSQEQTLIRREELSDRFRFLEYHKWRFDVEWFTPIVGDLIFRASAKMGYLGLYNRSLGLSPFERFELGGDGLNNQQTGITGKDIIRLRGYEVNDIRRGLIDDPSIFNKFELELRYPISTNPNSTIYVLGFLEGGNAWNRFSDYNPFDLRRSAGLGLRVFLPMFGLLGFDYGFGFDKPDLIRDGARWSDYGNFSLILGFEPD